MDSPNFSRSPALNNIPNKKVQDYLDTINNSTDDDKVKHIKVIAANRYAESNIPVEYWSLKMHKDFHGDPRLLEKFNRYVADIKSAYMNGTSICLAGSHGLGKQLCLETDLPTPNGFIKLKNLQEGDQLFDEEGNICNVTKLHPIQISPESYEITFDDGEKVKACADHLWLTYTRKDRSKNKTPTVKNTLEILKTLKVNNGKRALSANHSIPCTRPLNYNNKDLLIQPYVLGCWLGDGTTVEGTIESADPEILNHINDYGYSINLRPSTINKSKSSLYRIGDLINSTETYHNHKIGELTLQLKKLNLLGNKHIPDNYLYSSYEQRLELLQGLLDTDGCCLKNGLIEFCTVLPKLAEQVCQLIRSFGIKTKIKKNDTYLYEKKCKDRYRITFTTKLPVFKLQRKLNNIRLNKTQLSRSTHRFIVDIKPIKSIPMRCITVDSDSHLFLITKSFIPTHNTMTTACILKKASEKGYTCLYTTLSDIVSTLTVAGAEDKHLSRKELVMVDFLVIDEFDSRFMPSDNAADLYARTLENVFRTRSQNKLPTLMCTNSPNVVESFNGQLKQSIGSLMSGYIKPFPVFGEDFRKKQGEAK